MTSSVTASGVKCASTSGAGCDAHAGAQTVVGIPSSFALALILAVAFRSRSLFVSASCLSLSLSRPPSTASLSLSLYGCRCLDWAEGVVLRRLMHRLQASWFPQDVGCFLWEGAAPSIAASAMLQGGISSGEAGISNGCGMRICGFCFQ